MDRDLENMTSRLGNAILNTTSDAILATDRDGAIRFGNRGAARIFGFAAEEAIGASLDLIIPEWLRKRHWDGYERVMATGETRYGAGEVLAVPAVAKGSGKYRSSSRSSCSRIPSSASPAWPQSCAMSPLVSRSCDGSSVKWRVADPTRMTSDDHDDIRRSGAG
jgi:PAS domain-containing protein